MKIVMWSYHPTLLLKRVMVYIFTLQCISFLRCTIFHRTELHQTTSISENNRVGTQFKELNKI